MGFQWHQQQQNKICRNAGLVVVLWINDHALLSKGDLELKFEFQSIAICFWKHHEDHKVHFTSPSDSYPSRGTQHKCPFFPKIAISRRLPPTKPLSGKSIWDLVEFILLVLSSLEWIPFITGHSFNPSFPTKGQQAQRKPFYIFQLWKFTPPQHELANRGGPPFAKLWQQKHPADFADKGLEV